MNRRKFFGFLAGLCGFAVGLRLDAVLYDSPTEYLRRRTLIDNFRGSTDEITLSDIPLILMGIAHTGTFLIKNRSLLEDYIKGSSAVVSEGDPWKVDSYTTTGKEYFEGVLELCQKHEKPVIYLDPITSKGALAQTAQKTIGTLMLSNSARELVKENNNRRNFLRLLAKGMIGFGLSAAANSAMIDDWDYETFEEMIHSEYSHPQFDFDHIVDYRNVEITNRLIQLCETLPPDFCKQGEYLLVNFGAAHTEGIKYYLNHRGVLKAKTAVYSTNYGLIDSDEVSIYLPQGGRWHKKSIQQ